MRLLYLVPTLVFGILFLHALASYLLEAHGLRIHLGFYKIDIPPNRIADQIKRDCPVVSHPLHRAILERKGINPDECYVIGTASVMGSGSSKK